MDDADLDTIFIDYGFVLNASESAILLDEKLVQETAAKLGFPNLKQLSRRAKELTESKIVVARVELENGGKMIFKKPQTLVEEFTGDKTEWVLNQK